MNIYRYEVGSENLIQLQEISISCELDELDNLIEFLKKTKDEHNKCQKSLCHSHFRDWKNNNDTLKSDIIIVTGSEEIK